jgi:hypothetical protein
MLARHIHSGLLQKFVNYGQKSFKILAPGATIVKHSYITDVKVL